MNEEILALCNFAISNTIEGHPINILAKKIQRSCVTEKQQLIIDFFRNLFPNEMVFAAVENGALHIRYGSVKFKFNKRNNVYIMLT